MEYKINGARLAKQTVAHKKMFNKKRMVEKQTSAFLGHVFLHVHDENLVLATNNGNEWFITTLVGGVGATESGFLIEYTPFFNIINVLDKSKDVTLKIDHKEGEQTGALSVLSDGETYNMGCEYWGMLPPLPDFTDIGQTLYGITCEELAAGLSSTLPLTSTDSLRPNMCGVYIEAGGKDFDDGRGDVCFHGTNGHMLMKHCYFKEAKEPFAHILPFVGTDTLLEYIKKNAEKKTKPGFVNKPGARLPKIFDCVEDSQTRTDPLADITAADKHVRIKIDGATMIAKTIDDKYPNIASIFSEHPERLGLMGSMYTGELKKAIDGVLKVANKTTHNINLFCDGGDLIKISAQDVDFELSGTTQIRIYEAAKPDGFTVSFNGKFLISVLDALGCERVSIRHDVEGGTKFGGYYFVDSEQKSGGSKACLLMQLHNAESYYSNSDNHNNNNNYNEDGNDVGDGSTVDEDDGDGVGSCDGVGTGDSIYDDPDGVDGDDPDDVDGDDVNDDADESADDADVKNNLPF